MSDELIGLFVWWVMYAVYFFGAGLMIKALVKLLSCKETYVKETITTVVPERKKRKYTKRKSKEVLPTGSTTGDEVVNGGELPKI